MIYQSLQSKKFSSGGYTLLFAVLVSSVVLSIGISILNISKKEFLLASSARESTSAFYAADSGLECAMYWNDTGAIDFVVGVNTMGNSVGSISCALSPAIDVIYRETDQDFEIAVGGFVIESKFDVNINNTACAIVSVRKYQVDKGGSLGVVPVTSIGSRGYNFGWDSDTSTCSKPSPRRVERALRFTF